MDKNKVKSISSLSDNLHDEVNKIYEALMDNEFKEANDSIDIMMESLKHLKTSLKEDEV
jgi:flagellin-specific chaperone FliS